MNVRVSLPRLVAYGVGEIAVTVGMTLFGLFVLFFYSSVMGLPAFLVGVGAASGLLWDSVVDPYIGYRSDRTRGPLGRRHGYMLAGSLLMGGCFYLLLSPPRGLTTWPLFGWLLASSLLFRTTSALFRIPYLGLGAELSDDYSTRTRVVAVRSFFGLCGTIAAAGLSFALFFGSNRTAEGRLVYEHYPNLGFAAAVVMTFAALIATAFTPRTSAAVTPAEEPFATGFRSAWRSAAFRRVWLSYSLFFLSVVLNAVLAIDFYTWYVRIGDSRAIASLQTAFYVGALAGVLGWLSAGHRREKLPMYLAAVVGTAAAMIGAVLLFGDGHAFGTGRFTPLLVGHVLAGVFASAVWVLPGSMLADVADAEALATGRRREGLLFGLLNFGEKIAAGAALVGGGALLQFYAGLHGQAAPDALTTWRIGVSFGLVPAALLAAAAVSIAGYQLNRESVSGIQQQLRAVV